MLRKLTLEVAGGEVTLTAHSDESVEIAFKPDETLDGTAKKYITHNQARVLQHALASITED